MSITVNNITKIYGDQKALNNVSFEINTGEIVGFIGPNGAGKSTMMKIITGFIPQTSGEIFINDLKISGNEINVKKIIGYLPENNPLYTDMYVKEYLLFVGGIYKVKNIKLEIEAIINKTGLAREQHKKISALSKGYRQRVGLAQALIHNPEILILDEPTTGLDPNQIIEIRNLISEVGKEKTVMLSTHIMQEVEAICDRVIIIDKGKIIANDSSKNIIEKSNNNKFTIVVEFNTDVELKLLNSINNIESKNIDSKNWIIESNEDIREKIFSFAVENDIKVLSMQKKEKSLEEVFQELTN